MIDDFLDLLGEWSMDESSGHTLFDSSGYERDIELNTDPPSQNGIINSHHIPGKVIFRPYYYSLINYVVEQRIRICFESRGTIR